MNLAILAYLIWTKRLFGVRGGIASLERELAADVDWDELERRAPLTEQRETVHPWQSLLGVRFLLELSLLAALGIVGFNALG